MAERLIADCFPSWLSVMPAYGDGTVAPGGDGGKRAPRGRGDRVRQSMQESACWRFAGAVFGLMLVLGGCSGNPLAPAAPAAVATDDELNVYPANYKAEVLGAMHAYLNDPTGIRDAGISPPALKPVGDHPRYVVCVRFNAKKARNVYAGAKVAAAMFLAGRLDHMLDAAHEQCAGAAFAPFPDLQKLTR